MVPTARAATTEDIPELVRLRGVLFSAMGWDSADDWHDDAAQAFAAGLSSGDLAVIVVDDPAGGLCACGAVSFELRLPGPGFDGQVAYVSSMVTEPAWRGRGLAREVLDGLLGVCASRGVRRVDLNATDDGRPLYVSRGFVEPGGNPLLTLRL